MVEYIPKINLPVEGVEHARWLERRAVKHTRDIESILGKIARLESDSAAGAKLTSAVHVKTRDTGATVSSTSGLPAGGTTGMALRKKSATDGAATWTYEWQGLMPEYWVTLDSVNGASYFTSSLGGPGALEVDNEAIAQALLPPVQFDATGTIMLPIDFDNYIDAAGSFGSSGQAPIHLYVEVFPSFAGEEFTIFLPASDNAYGVTSPFYTFELYNAGAYDASVSIGDADLYYEGTTIPVLGVSEPFANPWSIAAGFQSAWFVRNVKGWGTAATPVTYYTGSTPEAALSDPWYEANVQRARHSFEIPKDGALAVATIPRRTYNNTGTDLAIGTVSASVGTAPSGADLTLVLKKNGSSITTTFTVASGANTGTATLSNTVWAPGDYLTVEVTQTGSAADLNVQIWAG